MASSVKLDDALKSRIERLARLRDRSPQWIMQKAIRQYVDREEARERFRREALASWAAYHDTRQHLTGEEMLNWLDGPSDRGVPACHN